MVADAGMIFQRIKGWFAYQAQNKALSDNHSWFPLLQRLHESANPKPRKHSVVHQFMLEEPTIVNTEFKIRFSDGRGLDGTQQMNRRYDIAKKLLVERYPHRNLSLEANSRADHDREMQQWSLTLSSIGIAPDVDVCVSLPLTWTS